MGVQPILMIVAVVLRLAQHQRPGCFVHLPLTHAIDIPGAPLLTVRRPMLKIVHVVPSIATRQMVCSALMLTATVRRISFHLFVFNFDL